MTSQHNLLRAGIVAATTAFVAALLMGMLMTLPDAALSIQPSYPPARPEAFLAVINNYPQQQLRFFAADTLFVLGYLLVFAVMYGITTQHTPVLAAVGLVAGVVTGICDALENGFFITFALSVQQGVVFTDGEIPFLTVYMLSNMKWMAAFLAMAAFGLALPRDTRLAWLVAGLALLFPLVGAAGIAWPALTDIRGLFLLVGMLLFALYFWQRLRQLSNKPGGMKK